MGLSHCSTTDAAPKLSVSLRHLLHIFLMLITNTMLIQICHKENILHNIFVIPHKTLGVQPCQKCSLSVLCHLLWPCVESKISHTVRSWEEKHYGGWLQNIWNKTSMTRNFELPHFKFALTTEESSTSFKALFQNYSVTEEDDDGGDYWGLMLPKTCNQSAKNGMLKRRGKSWLQQLKVLNQEAQNQYKLYTLYANGKNTPWHL